MFVVSRLQYGKTVHNITLDENLHKNNVEGLLIQETRLGNVTIFIVTTKQITRLSTSIIFCGGNYQLLADSTSCYTCLKDIRRVTIS